MGPDNVEVGKFPAVLRFVVARQQCDAPPETDHVGI
jgi:hypothetical protein